MAETWYVLKDGTYADPNECAPDEAGVLRHANGVEVAMRGNAYSSRSVNPDDCRPQTVETDDAKPKRQYRTRQMKAED